MWSGKSVLVEKKVNFDHNGPRVWAEDEYLLGSLKPRSVEVICHPGGCFRKFCWHG